MIFISTICVALQEAKNLTTYLYFHFSLDNELLLFLLFDNYDIKAGHGLYFETAQFSHQRIEIGENPKPIFNLCRPTI